MLRLLKNHRVADLMVLLAVAILVIILLTIQNLMPKSYAGENNGVVQNVSGAAVSIDCNLTKTANRDHYLYEKASGKKWMSSQFADCPDADAFNPGSAWRCLTYQGSGDFGPSYPVELKTEGSGWWKVSGRSVTAVQAYTKARCGNAPRAITWFEEV